MVALEVLNIHFRPHQLYLDPIKLSQIQMMFSGVSMRDPLCHVLCYSFE